VALLLGVLLAGLVLSYATGPRKTKPAELQRWLGWGLIALPLLMLLFRGGSFTVPALLLAFAAAARQWQRSAQAAPRAASTGPSDDAGERALPRRMSRREALEVLGLSEGASRDDVLREYRRLMKRLHPDVGGSSYLATKLNEAREVLT
jgi:hypothetical protein